MTTCRGISTRHMARRSARLPDPAPAGLLPPPAFADPADRGQSADPLACRAVAAQPGRNHPLRAGHRRGRRARPVDPSQMENALLNLTFNARDAMPDGGTLRIETQHTELPAEQASRHGVQTGEYLCVRVIDTGIGIPAPTVDKVFEPSSRPSPSAKVPGSACRWSTASSARAAASSPSTAAGQGDPRRPAHASGACRRAGRIGRGNEPRSRCRGGRTVLLVEDDDTVRPLLQSALEDFGYRVHRPPTVRAPRSRRTARFARPAADRCRPAGAQRPPARRNASATAPWPAGGADHRLRRTGRDPPRLPGPGMQLMTKPFSLELLAETVARAITTPVG